MSVIDRIPAGTPSDDKPWERIVEDKEVDRSPNRLNTFQVALKLQEIINYYANTEVDGSWYTEPVDLVVDGRIPKYQVRAGLSREIGQVVYLVDKKEDIASLWFSIDPAGPTIIDGRGDRVENEEDWVQIADVFDGMLEQFQNRAMEKADSLDIAGLVEDVLEQRINDASENLAVLQSKGSEFCDNELNMNNFRVRITGTTTEDCIDELIPTQSLSSALSIAVKIYKAIEKHSGSSAKCAVEIDLGDGVLIPVPDEAIQDAFGSLVRR